MADETKTKKQTSKFDYGNAPAFVLIPYDEKEQRPCQDAFEVEFSSLETPPRVVKELRVGRLPSNAVIYVCHPYNVRERDAEGEYVIKQKVHISDALFLKNFSLAQHDDDGLGLVNVPAIVDALQGLCKNSRSGKVFRAQLSADDDWSVKTVKLFNN
jgi:hypothetical protein